MIRRESLFWLMLAVMAGVYSVLAYVTSGVDDRTTRERQSSYKRQSSDIRESSAAVAGFGSSPVEDETAETEEGLSRRDYDVTDLVGGPPGNMAPSLNFATLTELIESGIAPDSWTNLSGPGVITAVRVANSSRLSIQQTPEIHAEIRALLAELRRATRGSADGQQRPILLSTDRSPDARGNAAIRAALEKTVEIDCDHEPLDDVLARIGKQLEIPVWLDMATLTDDGVAMDQPVTLHVHGTSGRSALKLVLAPARLTWFIEDALLKVTIFGCPAVLPVQLYDVTDVVGGRTRAGALDLHRLADFIQSSVEPDMWDRSYGPGSIRSLKLGAANLLAIRQTATMHDEILALLADLRAARRTGPVEKTRPFLITADVSPTARREASIRRALDKQVRLAAVERPVEELVGDVASQVEVQVVFDRGTIEDDGVSLKPVVTVPGRNTSARSALQTILEPLQLALIVRDEVLTITTSMHASREDERHVYDITDIVPRRSGDGGISQQDSQPIIDMIKRQILPESWDLDCHSILGFRSAGINVLIVEQSQAVHEEIAQFLEDVRNRSR